MTLIDHEHLRTVSLETLENFEVIASAAQNKMREAYASGQDSLVPSNTFPDRPENNRQAKGRQNISAISSSNREGYTELTREPAICRVQALDADGELQTYYIARTAIVTLENGTKLASYKSPVGRLASLSVGEEITLQIGGKTKSFELLENVKYQPRFKDGEWDSLNTILEGEDYGPLTVESLRTLLKGARKEEDAEALLNNVLLEGSSSDNVLEGLRHEIRHSMALRDQPILDKFQDEIFRLPIDSQLLILGPPGTGKTTTLIRRLGQKLDRDVLTPEEKSLISSISQPSLPHEQSWVMFTPTELLKHFVKEAFSREQVPASNERIKTWEVQRNEIARNTLGILQSSTDKGKFVLKSGSHHLLPEVEADPIAWFDAFQAFHQQRILSQFQQGLTILLPLQDLVGLELVHRLVDIIANADSSNLMAVYRALDERENQTVPLVKRLKEQSDQQIKKGLVRLLNQNRRFVEELAVFIDSLQDEDEADEDGEFDEDLANEAAQQPTSQQKAIQVYNRSIRTIARSTFLNRSLPSRGMANKLRQWLGSSRLPAKEELRDIGKSIAAQNGLRRFIHASRRLVADVPAGYRQFRTDALKAGNWYEFSPKQPRHLEGMELDAVVLLTLRMARELLTQNFVTRNRSEPRFSFLDSVSDRFFTQVLVDEATDFSPLQLACMASLARLETGSFFACGDFNQRITKSGTRSHEQTRWAVKGMNSRSITTVYRQSQSLNDFSSKLLEKLGGDLNSRGALPEQLHHAGVPPVLLEDTDNLEEVASWLAERIQEVERIVNIGDLPTIAVLVNAEEYVKPMAAALNQLLEDINLRAIAYSEGQSLGVGSEVRVFDVQHIKGLEFEAVFFVGIDQLAEQWPDLFGRFLYVGTTRAATYLGLTCHATLPSEIDSLRDDFIRSWGE